MPNENHDWKKVVAASNGAQIFLPDGFKTAQEELNKERLSYNEAAVKMAEREIKMNVANQNLFLEIRKHLAKNGYPDIWVKEIGFDANALKENIFIINIRENGGQ